MLLKTVCCCRLMYVYPILALDRCGGEELILNSKNLLDPENVPFGVAASEHSNQIQQQQRQKQHILVYFLIPASTNTAIPVRLHEKHVNDERDTKLQAVKPGPIKKVFVHHLSLFRGARTKAADVVDW